MMGNGLRRSSTKPHTSKYGAQERPVATGILPTEGTRVSEIMAALKGAANIPHLISQVRERVYDVVPMDSFTTDGTTEVAGRVLVEPPHRRQGVAERQRAPQRKSQDRSDWRGMRRAPLLVQQTI